MLHIEYGGLYKVISGGQTGADEAGLSAARMFKLETGGTAPANFQTEAGPNPKLAEYGLVAVGDYASRTVRNVRDSDGTLILAYNLQSPGTVLTRRTCFNEDKFFCEIDIDQLVSNDRLTTDEFKAEVQRLGKRAAKFVVDNHIQILNIAGNREIQHSGGTVKLCSQLVLLQMFTLLAEQGKLIESADLQK